MSFALNIKKEVLSQEFTETQAKAFIFGLISSSSERVGSKLIIKINNQEIAYIIRDMMNQLNMFFESSKENKNWIVIKKYEYLLEIKQPSYFFAGTFVGGGSISDSQSNSYHLEIQFYSHAESEKIKFFLNKYSFKFCSIQRRKLFILYLKKSDQISDFLRAIQSFKALLIFEDARISRDFHNQLNRYSNLDTYNQKKLAKSSSEFLVLYEKIIKENKCYKFREPELLFFELKKKNSYSSLNELTKKMFKKHNIKKTRAGLNHWLIKLRKISSKE